MNKRNKPKTQQSASPVQYFPPATSARRRIETSLKQTSSHKLYPNRNSEIKNNQIKFDSPTCLNVCLAAAKYPWAAELPGWPTQNQDAVFMEPKVRVLQPAALRNKQPCRATPTPLPAFHCTWEPIVRRQLQEERNERNIVEATLPHSDDLELASSARLTPSCLSTHMWCVCVYIYIYIFIAFYLLLKYCTDGPMVITNYRKMKLILNNGSRVPDCIRYVLTQCTNTTWSTPFNFTLCIQCAKYIDRKRVYKGMMTTHQKNHLHIFETSPARVYTT